MQSNTPALMYITEMIAQIILMPYTINNSIFELL